MNEIFFSFRTQTTKFGKWNFVNFCFSRLISGFLFTAFRVLVFTHFRRQERVCEREKKKQPTFTECPQWIFPDSAEAIASATAYEKKKKNISKCIWVRDLKLNQFTNNLLIRTAIIVGIRFLRKSKMSHSTNCTWNIYVRNWKYSVHKLNKIKHLL